MSEHNDQRQDDLLAASVATAYQTPVRSEAFQARLAVLRDTEQTMIGNMVPVAVRRRFSLRAASLIGVVATGAIASAVYLTLVPSPVAARAALITRMTSAIRHVSTAHIVQWQPMNGERKIEREFWYAAAIGKSGAWKTDDRFHQTLQRDGWYYSHQRKPSVVRIWESDTNLQPISPPLSVAERLARLRESGLLDHVSLLPDANVAGRPARRLQINLPPSKPNIEPAFYPASVPLREIVAVDPRTDLAFRTVTEALYQGQWRAVRYEDATYNTAIEPERFATTFPGAKVITPEIAAAEAPNVFYQHLAASRQTATVGKHKLTLRGIDLTALGDVYLLYSVPPGAALPTVALRDHTPRTWVYQGGGMVGRILPEIASDWTFPNGERLCIAWFRNDKPMTYETDGDWKVTFTFPGSGGGTSPILSPDSHRMHSGAIPQESPYREILQKYGPQIAAACRARAAAIGNGKWKEDADLLRFALQGQYPLRKDQARWETEARRIEREVKQR